MTTARLYARLLRHPRAHTAVRRGALIARHVARHPHEPDFAAFALFGKRDGIFLDVGANTGISALSFRAFDRQTPILSVEPNPFNERDLQLAGRLARRFRYVLKAAGDQHGELTLYTPIVAGVPLTPEASLSLEHLLAREPELLAELGLSPGARPLEVAETTVPVVPLDELAIQPAFVKIDVQGWEPAVVRGLAATLDRHRPVIMVETGHHLASVDALLAPMDYQPYVYDPAHHRLVDRGTRAALNIFYIPEVEDKPPG